MREALPALLRLETVHYTTKVVANHPIHNNSNLARADLLPRIWIKQSRNTFTSSTESLYYSSPQPP